MKLRSLVIDGADNLERVDSGELPNGLVVVYSPDDQRKATALTMMRRLLFSANGGDHSSAVSTARLSASSGEFELSTNGSPESETLRRLSGVANGGDDLDQVFGVAERGQLGAILDVSDRELPRDVFARPPIRSSAVDVPSLDTLLQRKHEILSADEDGDDELSRLIAELAAAQARLDEALAAEASFLEHRDGEAAATAEVGRLCADLADLRRRRQRLKTYVDLWPVWAKRQATQRQLDALEPIDDFPESDLSIVEAQEHSRSADEALRRLHQQLRQARAELEATPEAGDRHQFADEADAICVHLPEYRKRMTRFARARARNDEINTLAPQIRSRVGSDTDTPSGFDPDGFDLDSAREWLTRSEAIGQQEVETRDALNDVRKTLKQLRSERQRAVRAAKTLRAELDDSDEYWRALWSLRDDLEELWEVQSQGEGAARAAEARLEALEGLDRRKFAIPDSRLRGALWLAVVGCFAGALWMTRSEEPLHATLFGVAVVLGIAADFALGWRARWAELRNADTQRLEEKLRHELDRARQRRDARWKAADEVTRRIENAARALGLPGSPNLQDVDDAEEKLFGASRKLTNRGPLAETALAIHDRRDEEERLMNQLREMREVREATALEWEEWKKATGLPADLEQSGLTTFLCEFDRLRELREEAVQVDQELRELAPLIEEWEDQARSLLRRAGAQIHSSICGRALEDQLSQLRESAHRSARLQARRGELADKLAELEAEETEVAQRSRKYSELFRSLRDRSGTTDQEEFERRRQVFLERRALTEGLAEQERVFVDQLEAHKLADEPSLREDLSTGDADSWSSEGNRIEAEIKRREERLESVSHQRTEAAAACARIEQSSEVDLAQQECANLRHEIHQLADEWRTLALAEGLIDEAARSLSDRSVLLAEASTSLRALTLGELVRVTAADGDGVIGVVDRGGNQYTLDDLPQDWLRPLALSLRLGLVREASQGDDALPVLVDEVLRDLDDAEVGATAAEIHKLASRQQVFYFTSNESSLEALRSAGPVSRVLRV